MTATHHMLLLFLGICEFCAASGLVLWVVVGLSEFLRRPYGAPELGAPELPEITD